MVIQRNAFLLLGFTGLILLGCWNSAKAENTDTIVFANGDRLTGEIKSLDMGKLKFDTDESGVIALDWDDVSWISSPNDFEMSLRDHSEFFGTLGRAAPGYVELRGTRETRTVALMELVSMKKVERGFWPKVDGSLEAGFSFTKASQVLQYNLGGKISYRNQRLTAEMGGSMIVTEQEELQNTRKSDLNLTVQYTLVKRWYVAVNSGLGQNSELGLDLRVKGGVGLGNDFIYTNAHRFHGTVGTIVNAERAIDSTDYVTSSEGVATIGYLLFNSGVKDFYVDANATVYPSFSIPGRYRGEININPKVEIVNNLKFGFRYYYQFDTRPVSEAASTEDWGVISTLSYSF
ncbi:DUF481 domain-containing protein [bacterium SCSIO 12741]|nr:DUF481 domain-containing protein [bacterium SCSIO 12741]